ncbi:MAG: MFS transporter [Spirochaetales bacterium]|nr:MFS transporter [Spirochaetales bacterium]
MAMGFQIPFLSLYLKKILPHAENGLPAVGFIGFVFFIQPFLGVFSNPVMGVLGDKFSIKKKLLFLSGIMVMLAAVIIALPTIGGFSQVSHFILVGVGFIIYGFFYSSLFPLLDSETLDFLNKAETDPGLYGRFRMMGTLAYIFGATLLGTVLFLLNRMEILMWFIAGSFLLFSFSGVRTISKGIKKVKLPLRLLFKDKPFFLFLIYMFLFSFGHNIAYIFTPYFMDDYNINFLFIGLAFALSAALEIPVMYNAHKILKKFGIEKMLILGSLLLIVKLGLLYFLAPLKNSYLMMAAMSLHGVGYGLQFNAVIQYVNRSAPRKLSGTYMHMMNVIGLALPSALSSFAAAFFIQTWGSGAMIGINALIALSGVVFFMFTSLKRPEPARQQG